MKIRNCKRIPADYQDPTERKVFQRIPHLQHTGKWKKQPHCTKLTPNNLACSPLGIRNKGPRGQCSISKLVEGVKKVLMQEKGRATVENQ